MGYTGNPLLTTNYIADYYSGNGTTTTFILSQAPANVNGIIVFVNNQAVYPDGYSVNGLELTFNTAPGTGTNNISVRYLGAAGTPYVPGPASVQNSMIANGFVLTVPQGGTGTTVLNGYLFGNGIGSVTAQSTIPNSGLTNNSLTISPGTGLSGGGSVALGGTVTLSNAGVTSLVAGTGISVSGATGAVTVSLAGGSTQFSSLGVGTAASGTTGEIRATNNITAFFSSDAKFKESVESIPNALNIVNAIGGKLFDWTDEYIDKHGGPDGYFINKQDFGVIAQDVAEHFPLAVRRREDGTLAVDYQKLCVLAFQAIAELTERLAILEAGAR